MVRPQTHTRCPGRGLTRRLRRESGAAAPRGAHTFLSMAKEKCAKDSQRHGDSRGGPRRYAPWASVCGSPSGCPRPRFAALTRREKGSYCPFCRRGSLCRAHPNWQDFTCYRARSELAFFRRQNGRAFFPPLPIAALLPRSWHWADSKKCKLGCFGRDWVASQRQKASFFFLYNWHCTYSTNGAGMIRCCLDIFATQKASVISYPRWPFMRAMRPVAEWRSFLFNWRFTTPDPRAVAPVVPRR